MHKALQGAVAAALAFTAFGAAQAGINDDIQSCRVAIEEAELLGDAPFKLTLVKDYGKRNRTLTLEAVVVGGEDRVIECNMKRSKVLDVALADEA